MRRCFGRSQAGSRVNERISCYAMSVSQPDTTSDSRAILFKNRSNNLPLDVRSPTSADVNDCLSLFDCVTNCMECDCDLCRLRADADHGNALHVLARVTLWLKESEFNVGETWSKPFFSASECQSDSMRVRNIYTFLNLCSHRIVLVPRYGDCRKYSDDDHRD